MWLDPLFRLLESMRLFCNSIWTQVGSSILDLQHMNRTLINLDGARIVVTHTYCDFRRLQAYLFWGDGLSDELLAPVV